ncbi:MAG: hypothetical protein M1822_005403 [Bathelium mastoideum]|nr:MAG: hypothetical protein M1822_005403 [Bathelium mastoideum]
MSGDGGFPQLFSDRIMLTPPYPGNRRSGIWTESPADFPEWTASLDFRASGPERAGGNLQLWFANNGEQVVGKSSVYTTGPFDGLVLVFDQYGGRGGGLRGFLNDGNVDYKTHTSVDSLAFGHCDYPYRNLGRFSSLKVQSTAGGLKVSVDDKVCFASDKVKLPSGGYYFGITAGSPETPDSFEVNKFTISSTSSPQKIPPTQQQQQQQQQASQQQALQSSPGPDTSDFTNRLQQLSQQTEQLTSQIQQLSKSLEERHASVIQQLQQVQQSSSNPPSNPNQNGKLDDVARRLDNIERTVGDIKRDIEGKDYSEHLANLHSSIRETREGLMGSLPGMISSSAPRMGFFLFVVIAFQVMLAGSYIVYKRRRANAPKKFL